MYPSPSDFTKPERHAAWWYRQLTTTNRQVCQGDGYNVLNDVQSRLRERAESETPVDWNGRPVNLADPAFATPGALSSWGVELLRVLHAFAKKDRAPGAFVAAIQHDATSGTLSATTLQTALWEAYYSTSFNGREVNGLGSPAEILIAEGTTLPVFGSVPPLPSAGANAGATCMLPQVAGPPPMASVASPAPFVFNSLVVLGVLGAFVLATNLLTRNTRKDDRAYKRFS